MSASFGRRPVVDDDRRVGRDRSGRLLARRRGGQAAPVEIARQARPAAAVVGAVEDPHDARLLGQALAERLVGRVGRERIADGGPDLADVRDDDVAARAGQELLLVERRGEDVRPDVLRVDVGGETEQGRQLGDRDVGLDRLLECRDEIRQARDQRPADRPARGATAGPAAGGRHGRSRSSRGGSVRSEAPRRRPCAGSRSGCRPAGGCR